MGASVEDQEAPHLLIFIELAPSKNDKLLRNDLLFAFQKHGAECTGLLLIFNVAEIRTIEADKLLRQLVTHERGPIIHHTLQVVRARMEVPFGLCTNDGNVCPGFKQDVIRSNKVGG